MKIFKGGVDTLDHLVEYYTCRRRTNRWSLNTFFYMLDVMAYNSYVLFRMKNSEKFVNDPKRKRRFYLENLAIDLIRPCIKARFEIFSLKNSTGCNS